MLIRLLHEPQVTASAVVETARQTCGRDPETEATRKLMWSVTRICQIAKITHRYTSPSADSSGLSESLDRLRLCYGAAQTAWG